MIRSKENSVYGVHYVSGLNLLTRFRLNFSHLNEHKFRYNFKDAINPMCSCGFEPETIYHYILRCKLFSDLRIDLFKNLKLEEGYKKLITNSVFSKACIIWYFGNINDFFFFVFFFFVLSFVQILYWFVQNLFQALFVSITLCVLLSPTFYHA